MSCPGSSSVFGVTVAGTPPFSFQWQKNETNLADGGNVTGSTTSNLTLLNESQSDSANYDVVITNAAGSVTSSVATLSVTFTPAEVTPIIVKGRIVGATITDGGCGYANPPAITFVGLGGTGATGYAQISDGSVTNIVITDAGSGYPTDAIALITPPLYPIVGIVHIFTNTPSATAIPIIDYGYIVSADVTASGSGYVSPPAISFSDVSGSGATAYAQLSAGSVTNIVINNPGAGYGSNAVINISATPTISVVIPSVTNLMLEQNYQLQVSSDLYNWTNQGSAFTATNISMVYPRYWNVGNWSQLFFRLRLALAPPPFLTNGLVTYYPFNGNANDMSGNGNNGILGPGIGFGTDRFGNPNSALFFTNGIGGEMTTTIKQPASNVFTIAMWFNLPTDYTYNADLIAMTDTQSGGHTEFDKALLVGPVGSSTTNNLSFYLFPGQPVFLPTPNNVADGQWHHVVATLSSQGMMLYLDGSLVATNSNTASQGFAGYWRSSAGQGFVDDIRIYNRSLSSNEVAQLYEYESTTSP